MYASCVLSKAVLLIVIVLENLCKNFVHFAESSVRLYFSWKFQSAYIKINERYRITYCI